MRLTRRGLIQSAAALPITAHAATPPDSTPQNYRMMIFSDPVAGREDEYNHWYSTRHLPDVVSVPGFVRARRLQLAPVQFHASPPLNRYLAYFEITTNDLASVFAEVNHRLTTGQTVFNSSFNTATAHMRTYRLIDDQLKAPADDATDGFHFVFNTPIDGKDAAFNDWYNNEHLPDMLTVPGFTAAQRGALAKAQLAPGITAPPYLAIFRFQAGDLAQRKADFLRVVPTLRNKPVMKTADGYGFVPVGPVLIGDDIRAQRRA